MTKVRKSPAPAMGRFLAALLLASAALPASAMTVGVGGSVAVTGIKDGADVTLGAQGDAAYSGTGSGSAISILKGMYANTLSPLPAQSTHGILIGAVEGTVPSGNADSGNAVKIGCVYNGAVQTYAVGQRGDCQMSTGGGILFTTGGFFSSAQDSQSGSYAGVLGTLTSNSFAPLGTGLYSYNGSTAERLRTVNGAKGQNTGQGVLAVEEAGRTFSNISTAATTTVKSGAGFLHTLTVNTYVASATITLYDNTAAGGTKIATITLPSTITSIGPTTVTYDVAFSTGLTIVTSGATDITAAYR